ncbi:c-type cytochrome [Thalassotalea sp. ND16A]|uniref:c-type cytochrome n=1 Tax=Thalassotalea sp. ND16A TaxID=1535422 RepID=UPI00051D527E|nr:cytochrome c [Thalassotalea sp. ND16A]KGJ98046.1 hypothetical protein ND16A_0851 [Thalassotalea sp. ND16A]
MFKYQIILFLFIFSATSFAENGVVQSTESVAFDSAIELAEAEINFDESAALAKQQQLDTQSVAFDSAIELAEDEINFDESAALAKQQQLDTQIEFCAPCHGKNGISNLPIYPNLAGQHQQYLLKQLLAFKYRRRKDAVMSPMVSRLNEDELVELAAYYASLSSGISHIEINGEFNASPETNENSNEN